MRSKVLQRFSGRHLEQPLVIVFNKTFPTSYLVGKIVLSPILKEREQGLVSNQVCKKELTCGVSGLSCLLRYTGLNYRSAGRMKSRLKWLSAGDSF